MALLFGNDKKVYKEIKSVLNITYDEFTKLDPLIKESWIDSYKAAKSINKKTPNRWKNNFDIASATKEVFEANQELAEINRCLNKNLSIEEYFMMDYSKKFDLKVSVESHKQKSKRVEEQANFPTIVTYEERFSQIANRAGEHLQSQMNEGLFIVNSEMFQNCSQEQLVYKAIKEETGMTPEQFLGMDQIGKTKMD